MSLRDLLAAVLMLVGVVTALLAAFGVVRMPDVPTRMSATSKASTLAKMCVFLALALAFDDLGVAARSLAAVAFVFLTAPLAAHAIGRAAFALGVPLFPGTKVNEMPRPDESGACDPEH
ncbi:MAG TPA: monovalent cation/H(+) antiporter subunit G [Thermoanaerobaculia bacterium]|nr:monovalent cation/H(+) antiporter subunit G [Thermoanaerobaculia bacterium]